MRFQNGSAVPALVSSSKWVSTPKHTSDAAGQSASSGHHSRAIVVLHFSHALRIGPWPIDIRASLDDYDHGLVIQDLTRRQEQVAERLTEDGYLKLPKFDPNHGKLLDRRAIETDGGCNS